MANTTIFCTASFEGVHRFEGAPQEVSYLRYPHRHMFGVRVEVEVRHDDREIEFVMLKHRLRTWLDNKTVNGVWEMDTLSCEQVARMVAKMIAQYVPVGRMITVTVDEDGENGAKLMAGGETDDV